MMMKKNFLILAFNEKTITILFYFFLFSHLFIWTLAPSLARHHLPMDAVEGSIWGQHWLAGYDKNPYLNAWITALAYHLPYFSAATWIYFFSQCSVVICFYFVWKFSAFFLNPAKRLMSVLLLEGMQYYNIHAIDFNDNTLELATWSGCLYFFAKALKTRHPLDWFLLGTCAGLGLMTKYYTGILLFSFFLYLLHPKNKYIWQDKSTYVALFPFIAICSPHVLWLFQHDFLTIRYIATRTENQIGMLSHIIYPVQFLLGQAEAIAPSFLLFGLLYGLSYLSQKKCNANIDTDSKAPAPSLMHRDILWIGLFAPLLITILLSALFGWQLHSAWGAPLFSALGIFICYYSLPSLSRKIILTFYASILGILCLGAFIYTEQLRLSKTPSSANFQGKMLADTLESFWHARFHQPLQFIGGPRFLAGSVSLDGQDHPEVWMEWHSRNSPWISLQDIQKHGAIFIWEVNHGEQLPKNIKTFFKHLSPTYFIELPWYGSENIPPMKIGMAWVPPQEISP